MLSFLINIARRIAAVRSSTFDLATFKSLKDADEILKYARDNLAEIKPAGSSRATFILNSKKVLKVSNHPIRGPVQNRKEWEASQNSGIASFLTRVYDHDPDFNWIISELVRPYGVGDSSTRYGVLMNVLQKFTEAYDPDPADQALKDAANDHLDNLLGMEGYFRDTIYNLMNEGYNIFELSEPSAWGISPGGRLVLLDYGADDNILAQYYPGVA
jgi:hypothetical protein